MPALKKQMYLDTGNLTRANRVLTEHGYPESGPEYVANIIARLAGSDPDSALEVYEMISYALNFDILDGEGREYIPEWLQKEL